jgi:hypothetical protein
MFVSIQANPSYTFAMTYKKLSFPIELGMNVNKTIYDKGLIIGHPKQFTYDGRFSAGFGVDVNQHFRLGANAVSMRAISNYVDPKFVGQVYIPQLWGGETRISYRF